MRARSTSDARPAFAFWSADQAAFAWASSTAGLLMCGPFARATPHQAIAQEGSIAPARSKERMASS